MCINKSASGCGFTNFHFVIYLLPLFGRIWIVSASIASPLPNVALTETFISNLSRHRFPNCALFFVRQGGAQFLGDDVLVGVVTRVGIVAYYNAIHSLPFEDEMEIGGWGSFNYSAISSSEASIHFKISVANYNRKASVCKLAVVALDDIRPRFLDQIKQSISPVYLPMVSTSSDPWVWITPRPDLLEPLLLSRALPARTKYKLGLSLQSPSGELVIRSVCFFCNEGQPAVLDLPRQNPKNFDYFPDRVLNLNGRMLRVVCPKIKSRIEADEPYQGINNAKRGMWKTLLEDYLMLKFNFTYNVFLSVGKDGGWGGGTGLELPNGTWIGTVGDLVAGRADIAVITASTPKRIKQVTFTNSFFDISCLNFITTYGARVFSPAALLWPFDLVMWGAVFLSTLAAFVVFKLLTQAMSWLGMDSEDAMSFARRGIVSNENWGIQHQIFFVATSYLDQDCVLPRFTPLRCFVALWLFFTLIITTIYRSKMVSLLAFPVLEKLPVTFEELVYSDYEIGFVKHGDSAYNTLKASTDPVYVKLVNDMEIITGNGLECLERSVAKKYGCILYAFASIYLFNRNLSDADIRKLVFAPESTYNIFMGLVLEGGSIYKEGFENWLGWTRPFHLADLWEKQDMYYNVRLPKRAWWLQTKQFDKLEHSESEGSDDLTLKHISGAFYALVAGLLICSVIFVQELMYYHRGNCFSKGRKKRPKVKIKLQTGMYNEAKIHW